MPVSLSFGLALDAGYWSTEIGAAVPASIALLGARDGFAIDFVGKRMVVNDSATPANAYDGDPEARLTRYGSQPYAYDPAKGLQLTAGRDFGIGMPVAAFPYDRTAIHVYARFTLDAADSADQRYLLMIANSGNNRFAYYTTSGAGFRWVTGDGTSADTETSSASLAAGTEYHTFFGADAHGRTWVDHSGIVTSDELHLLQAAAVSEIGIGGYNNQVLRSLGGHLAEIAVICEDVTHERRLTLTPFQGAYAAEGDSHTLNVSFGLGENEFYPARVAAAVPQLGIRNHGQSSDSTCKMLSQVDAFLSRGVPDVATIYGGSNDLPTTVAATPAPTATVFDVANAGDLAVDGWVIVGGESRRIAAISGTTVTLETALSAAPAAGASVEIDTQNNIESWLAAVKAAGTPTVGVIGSHYLNWPSAGDTPTAEQPARAAIRARQQAAAQAQGAVYVDTYLHMRDLIVQGSVAQGDWAVWHQGVNNTHLTAAGEQTLADAVKAALFP